MTYLDQVVSIGGEDKGKLFLFTLSTCIWCRKTKALLSDLGVSYDYLDVDLLEGEVGEAAMEEMHKYNPATSFPTIVVNNGENVILGFDEEKIRECVG